RQYPGPFNPAARFHHRLPLLLLWSTRQMKETARLSSFYRRFQENPSPVRVPYPPIPPRRERAVRGIGGTHKHILLLSACMGIREPTSRAEERASRSQYRYTSLGDRGLGPRLRPAGAGVSPAGAASLSWCGTLLLRCLACATSTRTCAHSSCARLQSASASVRSASPLL